jgi:hypothetical protein
LHFERTIDSVANHPVAVFWYFCTLYLACYVVGLGSQIPQIRTAAFDSLQLARSRLGPLNHWLGLDAIEKLYAQHRTRAAQEEPAEARWSEWRGIFFSDEEEGVRRTLVSATLVFGGTPYLYVGFLEHVRWDDSGNPDWIEISSAARRPLADDAEDGTLDHPFSADGRYYKIRGNLLMLRVAAITTLNVEYWAIEATEE